MTYAFDAELAAFLPMLPDISLEDLAAFRARELRYMAEAPAPDATGVDVSELTATGAENGRDVGLRMYRPRHAAGLLPLIYNIHSGGFIAGSVEREHARNLELCREVAAVVVSVDYRLAPEYRFPAALEDCYAGLSWLAAKAEDLNIDQYRIGLHGASAGAGLAAALALLSRDRGGPTACFQYLRAPEVDDRMNTTSMRTFVDTPGWSRPYAVISWEAYLGPGVPGSRHVSPYAAPARAGNLSGLPPAYISVMQFDPLRDEGIGYAQGAVSCCPRPASARRSGRIRGTAGRTVNVGGRHYERSEMSHPPPTLRAR